MLPRSPTVGIAARLAICALALAAAGFVTQGRRIGDNAEVSSRTRATKATQFSGKITKVDLKERTLVVTQRTDGAERDKTLKLTWHKKTRPTLAGKDVDWDSVKPGTLVTIKYTPGKDHNTLTELALPKN